MSDLRSEFEKIYAEHGGLSPELIVEAARPKTHPLHGRFEWNDKIAGHEYRLIQAAEMIRSVKVGYDRKDGSKNHIRWWHPVRVDSPTVYDPLDEIVKDDIASATLLRMMEREWKAMKNRWDSFGEFWELVRKDTA